MRKGRVSRTSRSTALTGRALARALNFECIKSASLPYRVVVRNFRNVERYFPRQLRGNARHALEAKRRVAKHLLEQAILHGCAQRTCTSRLKAAARLGFTNIEQEAHFRYLYARGALARGHRGIARKTTSEMIGKLERSLRKGKSLPAQQCLDLFQKLLAHLETQA
jgi:hypothetical protein